MAAQTAIRRTRLVLSNFRLLNNQEPRGDGSKALPKRVQPEILLDCSTNQPRFPRSR